MSPPTTQQQAARSGLAAVEAATAVEACRDLELGEEAQALLDPGHTPRQYLDRLVAKGLLAEAVSFLAHALRKREAVWWACRCARLAGDEFDKNDDASVQAAEAWVREPSEKRRQAAAELAERLEYGTAAALAAAAAGWSGGSMAPPDLAKVPPPDPLTGRAAGGAVLMAATAGEAADVEPRLERFLTTGIEVAEERDRWPEEGKR